MFQKAKAIWLAGKECEKNVQAVYKTDVVVTKDTELHVAGSVFYRIYCNHQFIAFGPARTAIGYVREDIFKLSEYGIAEGETCEIIIEAMGYYCRSVSTAFQSSCLMAEIQCNGEVVAYTGNDFVAYMPKSRVQKAERYTIHRHFCEVWDYATYPNMTDESAKVEIVVCEEQPKVLERVVPYPLYQEIDLLSTSCHGMYVFDESLPYKESRYPWEIPEWWGRFEWDEIPYHPYKWIQRQKQYITGRGEKLPITLKKGEYAIFDFGRIEAGFIKTFMETIEKSDVVIAFSEYYHGEEFQLPNMDIHNVIEYLVDAGEHRDLLSFEPYAFRFLMVAVKEGCIRLNTVGVKTYMFDDSNIALPDCQDDTLNAINRAALRTFVHNAVDVYTDCPSRERAGWLCDSYFTSKAEFALTGKTAIEDAFLENYRLYENRGEMPKGMLPEAYPSDMRHGTEFIPQWTMWYILEVYEYVLKRGHEDMAEAFRDTVYGLVGFFQQYENEDGLLERLPSRNFVEWSKANEWTWDVNYPTNFLYAQALECVYHLFGDEKCRVKSECIRKIAIEQSFNGHYFVDHAIRDENGVLQVQTQDSSEACQYYAVLFSGIDIGSETYQGLKELILKVFSPDRTGKMSEIVEVNAFIGAYLRMEVLLRMQEYNLLLENVKSFFGKMEEYTGTLWENRQFEGSYDHGFASYVLVVIEESLKKLGRL